VAFDAGESVDNRFRLAMDMTCLSHEQASSAGRTAADESAAFYQNSTKSG
jgi:hypothetical protein